jgi:replicative DNA helicase
MGHIKDIFLAEKQQLQLEDANLIEAFLTKISNQFENEEPFNEEYLRDKTLNYFKKRSMKITIDMAQALVELDRTEEAEAEIRKFKTISKDVFSGVNPITEVEVKKYVQNIKDKSSVLFRFPGAIGNMIGDFERDTLLGILSPAKRGKSFWILEIGIQAFFERLKVAVFSLEMNLTQLERRMYKRLTALGDESREFIYPTFDCMKNQTGTCRKRERTNDIRLYIEGTPKPEFAPKMQYQPCTICRGTRDFSATTWSTMIKREKVRDRDLIKHIRGLEDMYNDNFRLITYPSFSANISKIKWDLADMEENQNFIPDVICIDYADILAPEDKRQIGRERLDETWKMLKNLADTKHCLVVTASQSNRGSFKKQNVTQTDIAEDIRKIAHVDSMVALSQTPDEKREGIIRLGLIAERDGEFDEYKTCMVLQQLDLGQVFLDSELMPMKKKIEENA